MAQEPISRLKAGGVGPPDTTNPFLVQSKALWNKGWGRELGHTKLDAYQKSLEAEGLVLTPECPQDMPDHLNRLVLWDRRPLLVKQNKQERVSLVKTYCLCGIACGGDDDMLIQHVATSEIVVPVRWVWCQDGRMNRNRKSTDCRQSFVPPEVGAEALTGLFAYVQDPTVIGEGDSHVMDLPGSVLGGYSSHCAYLKVWNDRPKLNWNWDDNANPRCGSASR